MPIFPLKSKVDSYKKSVVFAFGAPRPINKPTRKHAGCDLVAPAGTEVFAVDDGYVIEASNTGFLQGTDSAGTAFNVGVVSIEHGDFYEPDFVARYGEVDTVLVQVGQDVKKGDLIAKVARQGRSGTQLHFEMFSGKQSGALTQKGVAPFHRRGDLIDPTAFLDSWEPKA